MDVADHEAPCDALVSRNNLPEIEKAECESLPPDKWPPDNNWHFDFRSRKAAFGGHSFSLTFQEARLLEVLTQARRALTKAELIPEVWGRIISGKTFHSTLSHLRTKLKREFNLPKNAKPIRKVVYEGSAAWELDNQIILDMSPLFRSQANSEELVSDPPCQPQTNFALSG